MTLLWNRIDTSVVGQVTIAVKRVTSRKGLCNDTRTTSTYFNNEMSCLRLTERHWIVLNSSMIWFSLP